MKFKSYYFLIIALIPLPFIALTKVQQKNNADEVVASLISTENWTPFYWGQFRLGSLVPFLASLFNDLVQNMLIQNWIHLYLFILFIVLVQVLLKPELSSKYILISVLIVLILTAIFWPRIFNRALPYGDSFGISSLAIFLLLKSNQLGLNRITALVLLFLANWVNPLVTFYLFAFYLCLIIKYTNFSKHILKYVLISALFGAIFLFYGRMQGESSGVSLPSMMPYKDFNILVPLIALQMLMLIFILFSPKHKQKEIIITFAATMLAWPSIYILSILNHVKENGYEPRYFIPLISVSSIILIVTLLEWFRTQKRAHIPMIFSAGRMQILIFPIVVANILSYQVAFRDAPLNKPIVDSMNAAFEVMPKPNFVSGDYWHAWPSKLYSKDPDSLLVLSDRMEGQKLLQKENKAKLFNLFHNQSKGICFGKLPRCQEYLDDLTSRMEISYEKSYKFIPFSTFYKNNFEYNLVSLRIDNKPERCWKAVDLPTQIGLRSGDVILSDSQKEGFLTFGPYIGVGPGDYEVNFDYDIVEQKPNVTLAYIDFAEMGKQIVGSEVKVEGSSQGDSKVKLKLKIKSYTSSFEARFYSFGNAKISIRGMCIKKMDETKL